MAEPAGRASLGGGRPDGGGSRRLTASLLALPGRVGRRLRRYYRRWFQHRNHVYVRRGPFPPEQRADCTFLRFEIFEEVPEHVREAIVAHGGQRALEADEREMRDGSALWIVTVEGRVAGVRHSRRGSRFRQWFVPLDENDVVVFRGRTFPEFRGRGLSPSMMRHIFFTELNEDNAAYTDCRVYNKPSIRSIEKAGFERVGTMRPIARDEVLGGAEKPVFGIRNHGETA